MVRGILFGLVAAALGAAAWAALINGVGYEIGFLAVGVGYAVGFAVAFGAGREANSMTGIAAALLAIGSVMAGKAAAFGLGGVVETLGILDLLFLGLAAYYAYRVGDSPPKGQDGNRDTAA